MIELKDWLDYVSRHPLLFRFDGLSGRGRSSKSDYHKTVGEAAAASESFMENYMSKEEESQREAFDKAVKSRKDLDDYLARFVECCYAKISAEKWKRKKLPMPKNWSKASLKSILAVVDAFIKDEGLVSEFVRDWLMSPAEHYWDMVKDDDGLLKEHPPVAAWYHAGEYEIDLEDIFFVCPSCHGEPHTEDNLNECYTQQNGYPYFYCGSCGSEMNVSKQEDIRDFFIAMDMTVYPFNPAKQAEWKKILADRKAYGDNKLELKPGESVHLCVCEDVPYADANEGTWKNWRHESGELVTILGVHNTTTRNGDVTTRSGIYYETWNGQRSFIEFHRIYGRPLPQPAPV